MKPGRVTVRGAASVPGRPDRVEMALSVSVLEQTPAAALEEVGRRAERLTGVLDTLGIGRDHWTTSGATVAQELQWDGQRQVHRGYRSAYRVAVRLSDGTLVGRLMHDAVEQAGAEVAGPWWRIGPSNPARLEACREAAANARRKAEAFVEGLGVRLGAVLGASEPMLSAAEGPVFRLAAAGGAATEHLDVQPGEQEVAATIDVIFRLEEP